MAIILLMFVSNPVVKTPWMIGSCALTRFREVTQLNKEQTCIFCVCIGLKPKNSSKPAAFDSWIIFPARAVPESWWCGWESYSDISNEEGLDLNHTLHPLLFPCARSSTKALPPPSTYRAYSSTATTVSACAPSDSARMLRSWVAPTAPQWPSPSSVVMWWQAAVQPAWGPGHPQSPAGPGEAWPTSSVLSSSWWFLPSSLFSLLLSSSILSLNEQFLPLSCRVIALFPTLCVLFWGCFFFSLSFSCRQKEGVGCSRRESWVELNGHSWWRMCNAFSGTCDSFRTLLPLSLCPSSVVSVLFTFLFHRIGFLCKRNSKGAEICLVLRSGIGLKRRFYSSVLITVYKYIYVYRNSHNLYFHWCV